MQESLTQGVVNDDVVDALRRFLPPAYRYKPGWEALIAGIASGDSFCQDNATKAFDQLFLSAASDDYLLQRAADQGVQYPEAVVMSDELFRKLAVLMSNNRLVHEALLEILEVFYGSDSTRARLESGAAEPYDLQAGDTIIFRIDDRETVECSWESNDFANINAATATEVAGVLSRAFRNAGSGAYANAVEIDGQNKVVVYSSALGLLGSIQVTGGVSNKQLQFATKYEVFDGTNPPVPGWDYIGTDLDIARFTWNKVGDVPGTLYEIEAGDYVIVDSANATGLRGWYEVTEVHIATDLFGEYAGYTWFEVSKVGARAGIGALSFNQAAPDDLLFFRPSRSTVVNNLVPSYIAQHQQTGGVDIILPATSQAVGREYNEAPYLHEGAIIEVTSVSRAANTVTVTTSVNHGLTAGQMVELRGVQGSTSGRWSIFGKVLQVTAPNGFTIYGIGDDGTGTGGEVHVMTAPTSNRPGPWVFDPASGLAITGIQTTITASIVQNRALSILPVADASQFPNEEGYVVFGFGTQYEVGPVRYLGVLSSTNLLLDKGFVFPKTVPSGSDLTWLSQKNPFTPDDNSIGLFLAVDSSAGRIAAQDFIDQAKAAGVEANSVVVYPSDKGLGGEGLPTTGLKVSDIVGIYAGDDVDGAMEDARNA